MSVDLGQHFLTDSEVLRDIITAADLQSDDVVLEIGPGKGVLTEELAKHVKRVIAVELDRTLVAELQKKFKSAKNVEIIHEDILRWWPQQNLNIEIFKHLKIVANIPYRITAPILRLFLEHELHPNLLVLMVQKEVAERVCAKPGAMSLLSVSVQYYATPEIVRIVPRTAFNPAPKVDSAILKIIPFKRHDYPEMSDRTKIDNVFFRLVKMGFSSRRKQLQNLLATGLRMTNEEAKKALLAIGLSPTVRAQELSIADWKKLIEYF